MSNVQPSEILKPGEYQFGVVKVGTVKLADDERVPAAKVQVMAPGTPQNGRYITVRWPQGEPLPSPGFVYRAIFDVSATALIGGRWVAVDPYEHRETNPRVRYTMTGLKYAAPLPDADVKTARTTFHRRSR